MKNHEIVLNRCCICDELFIGHGNNPIPVRDKGVCCDSCNSKVVIRARLRDSFRNGRHV